MNAAPAAKKTKPAPKAKPLNGDLLPNLEGPALRFIALDAIQVEAQVRTVFDDEPLAELAEDIKANGMLQPVLLRTTSNENSFVLIAGERRVRAARLAGLSAVPAIVGDVTKEHADDMQLAENIQREELNLKDLAAAVRRLHDREGKIDKVADIVKKSKSWVSKHLQLSCHDFGYKAKELLANGVTEDLELLTTFNALWKIDYDAAQALEKKIRAGKAGRKEAREALAKAKKEADAYEAKRAKEAKANKSAAKKAKNEPPPFYAPGAMSQVRQELQQENGPTVSELVARYTEEQQLQMLAPYTKEHQAGAAVKDKPAADQIRTLLALQTIYMSDTQATAFLLGASGKELTLAALLDELSTIWQM